MCERVSPQLLENIYKNHPMEPDDLALLLTALGDDHLKPEMVADYLLHMLRTCTADMQFSMLSKSEKEVLQKLVELLPDTNSARFVRTSLNDILH